MTELRAAFCGTFCDTDIRLCRIKRKRKTLHQLREEYMSLQEQQKTGIGIAE